ncbi:MAG: FimB/Mfa2 family fimbrial subunit [Rikenellaceae bacterium]|nr:FimB/Mfa2 family fimbrial subunit [Rikenellaceae bacterium]
MKAGYKTNLLRGAVALVLALTGCGIMEELNDCPQGIDLQFYSQTPCDPQPVYPAEMADLNLYVFNERNVLASFRPASSVNVVASEYTHTVEAKNGLYTVVAWAGLDIERFDLSTPVVGVTTKEDLLFSLRHTGGRALSYADKRVFYGESDPVYLPDPAIYGSVFKAADVNLKELTKRISVEVEGLSNPQDYEVVIESKSEAMRYDGEPLAGAQIEYQPILRPVGSELTASFTVMQLSTGFDTTLVIRQKSTGQELYRGDLLGTLLLKNPTVNLACDCDFTIRFTAADACGCGTYAIMKIWVNEWLVHSYETSL